MRHTPEKSFIAFPNHNHEIFEILYILNGDLKITLDKQDHYLSGGDIFLVNPFQLHYGEYPITNNSVEYLAFTLNIRKWFHIPYISSVFESILDCSSKFVNLVSSTDKLASEISDLLLNIEKLFNNLNTSNFFLISTEINKLFHLFFDNLLVNSNTSVQIKYDFDFTKSVAQYMKKTYTENISQSDLARIMHMSSSSFYKEFKKNFGMSFTNYIGFYRVSKAAEIYQEKPMPFTLLATLVAFSDYDYFSKTFKKHFGESPAHYFNKWNTKK